MIDRYHYFATGDAKSEIDRPTTSFLTCYYLLNTYKNWIYLNNPCYLRSQRGAVPCQNPSIWQTRELSPTRRYPVAHVYSHAVLRAIFARPSVQISGVISAFNGTSNAGQ